MVKLRPEETDLLGGWTMVEGKVVGDPTTQRIKELVAHHLVEIAQGGWDTLYLDPQDGRYWELIYPQSHLHGGGPPRLTVLSSSQARAKYGSVVMDQV